MKHVKFAQLPIVDCSVRFLIEVEGMVPEIISIAAVDYQARQGLTGPELLMEKLHDELSTPIVLVPCSLLSPL